ncbi:MAG TPA: hypothetical protein VIH82_11155 [Acidimicrobiia bacterium]|jgi:hypothetical protein
MALVVGFLAFGIVVAIAAVFVIREAGRIADDPPAAIVDPDDAYDWVVEHLPDDVAATLTADDVRRILDFQFEFFRRKGVAVNGSRRGPRGPVVVGGAEQVAYILERCSATGEAYIPEQVYAVVETQLSYLRAVGAVGPPTTPEEDPPVV